MFSCLSTFVDTYRRERRSSMNPVGIGKLRLLGAACPFDVSSLFVVLLSATVARVSATADGSDAVELLAMSTGNVTINCYNSTPSTAPHCVKWSSHAHSKNRSALVIFRSCPDFTVESRHPNADNYVVDRQHRLTIMKVDRTHDPGIYECRIMSQGKKDLVHKYDLLVGEKPTCEANATEVQDGDYVGLTCNMTFSGNGKPGMDWFAGEELLTSDDNSVVSKLRSDAARSVTTDDDRRPFRCIATLGNLQQVCDVTVEVPHSARSARMTPDKPVLHVGEEIKCSAKGNPSPQITLQPSVAGQNEGQHGGEAWKTMIVPAEWKGQSQTVQCTAVNQLGDETHQATASATFKVIAAASTGGSSTGNSSTSQMQSTTWCSTVLLLLSSLVLTLGTVQ